jgi:hypothetical protein
MMVSPAGSLMLLLFLSDPVPFFKLGLNHERHEIHEKIKNNFVFFVPFVVNWPFSAR